MVIESKQQDGFILCTIKDEEANIRNAEPFRKELVAVIEQGHKNILLSFENVTYIDSSFLGSIVSALKYALSKGSDIYLVNMRKDIYDLLCLIRMNKVFKIFETVDAAKEQLQ